MTTTIQTFRLPDAGEGLTEAEIVRWLVKPGDQVRVNDVLVEIETAKSLVELPSPYAGTVVERLAAEGVTVAVGAPIITVSSGSSSVQPPGVAAEATAVQVVASDVPVEPGLIGGPAPGGRTSVLVGYGPRTTAAVRRPRRANVDSLAEGPVKPQRHGGFEVGRIVEQRLAEEADAPHPAPHRRPHLPVTPAAAGASSAAAGSARVLAKPPVRKLARELGVDLHALTATGPLGTVSREDVMRAGTAQPSSEHEVTSPTAPTASTASQRETRVPVRGVRKATAEAMVQSAFTAPHVTEFVTVDVTRTMKLVQRLRDDPAMATVRVSPLLVVAKALMLAARRNPGVNASWDEAAGEIVVKHYVNLGIAAATPRGLVVPNVKDADRLGLRELAEALTLLTTTAREGGTPPGDLAGGTLTITNVGVFGVDTGTPILPPGQAAILALGAIGPRPWVHRGKVVPREVTTLALSFDHRMVDGDLGSRFLADVAGLLERPERALLWS